MRENILESVLDTLFENSFNVFFMRILILKNPLRDQIIRSKVEDFGAGRRNGTLVTAWEDAVRELNYTSSGNEEGRNLLERRGWQNHGRQNDFFSGRRDSHSLSGPLAGGQDWVSLGIGAEGGRALGAAELLHLALEGFPVEAIFVLLAPFFGVEFDAEPK